jgi:hypothetical protein
VRRSLIWKRAIEYGAILVELGSFEAEHLIEGRKCLSDLGLQDRLEIAAARAIGKPRESTQETPSPQETIAASLVDERDRRRS